MPAIQIFADCLTHGDPLGHTIITMRKPDRIEEAFQRLGALRANPAASGTVAELREFLARGMNLLAAKAARIVAEFQIAELGPDLVTAFHRFMMNPMKLDKGCAAMTEIAGALCALEYPECEVYLKGIRHVQVEPAFPIPRDTAAELRARSAMGLVQLRHAGALRDVVPLLVDPDPVARIGAVRAVAFTSGDSAELLLRLKVLAGDESPEVLGECFGEMLILDPEHSMPFVASQMESENPAVCGEAILALGESRRPEAFEILKEKWAAEVAPSYQGTLLLALAALRLDAAIDFLLALLETCSAETAAKVVPALSIYRNDTRIGQLVETAVSQRGSPPLSALFRREFTSGEE
jgi:hypothetical protein